MSTTNRVVWPLEPHTKAKHDILVRYLEAWFPILAQGRVSKRLIYIDGFAGPGEYDKGEPGSPMLALNVVVQHSLSAQIVKSEVEISFVFVEEDRLRSLHLDEILSRYKVANRLSANIRISSKNETFEHYMSDFLDDLENENKRLPPCFVFIDPFGVTGFPMSLIERLAQYERSELLINFSYQTLNEWYLSIPSKHPSLDTLFGNARWRPALQISDSESRERFLVEEYKNALEERGWRGLSFRMVNKHNQTQYYLLFGTKSPLGMLKMKNAMWAVAPDGEFEYSDFSQPNYGQPRLFKGVMNAQYSQELAESIWQNRRGTTATKESLLENETAYHPTCIDRHLTSALRTLEYDTDPPRIVKVTKPDGTRRNKGSYPKKCLIQFASQESAD